MLESIQSLFAVVMWFEGGCVECCTLSPVTLLSVADSCFIHIL